MTKFFAAVTVLLFTVNFASAAIGKLSDRLPESRHALIIGINDYENLNKLNNAVRDAELIAGTLRQFGFDVTFVENPDKSGMQEHVAKYAEKLASKKAAASVFYYAGHGFETRGATFLAPADFKSKNPDEATANSVTLASIVKSLGESPGDGYRIYFIDTTRTDPFSRSGVQGGLKLDLQDITVVGNRSAILYSTSPGADASDGVQGSNYGPFALSLGKRLAEPGLQYHDLVRAVRNDVLEATEGRQVPHEVGRIGWFRFNTAVPDEANEEPPETKAAKVLYRNSDGELATTYADGSYALLIGVGDYRETDTGRQAWNDLRYVEDELTRLGSVLEQVHGFEVEMVFHPSGDELEAALESFVNLHGPKPNARLMILMSGHGTTTEKYGRKTAWFVPADAPATEPPAPFLNTALNLRRVEEWSEIMAAKHVMWIFDSCFSGAAIRMIESKSEAKPDGWAEHLHQNPVRRVLTAGSENEEVPAKSRFTETLIKVLSGQTAIDGARDYITGQQIGLHLKQDIIRYNYKQGLPKNTPQSDTIVIPGEEGDVVFSIDPALSAKWMASSK